MLTGKGLLLKGKGKIGLSLTYILAHTLHFLVAFYSRLSTWKAGWSNNIRTRVLTHPSPLTFVAGVRVQSGHESVRRRQTSLALFTPPRPAVARSCLPASHRRRQRPRRFDESFSTLGMHRRVRCGRTVVGTFEGQDGSDHDGRAGFS